MDSWDQKKTNPFESTYQPLFLGVGPWIKENEKKIINAKWERDVKKIFSYNHIFENMYKKIIEKIL